MPLRGVKCVLGYVSLEDHNRCQLEEPGPPCLLSPTVLGIITRPNMEREREKVVFSPSSLSSCHRQSVLKRGHDWYIDVEAGYKTVRGTIVHEGLSHEPPPPGTLGVVRELRMKAPIKVRGEEHVFHGKADEVLLLRLETIPGHAVGDLGEDYVPARTVLHVKITDFKTVGEVSHELVAARDGHVRQVNMYAWLVQQFLPGWLNACVGYGQDLDGSDIAGAGNMVYDDGDCGKHLQLSAPFLPRIDEVIVDELSIEYMDMKKSRTFTSRGFLYAKGKMLGDRGTDGRWRRRNPPEYDQLELEPIHQFSSEYIEVLIRKGIEDQLDAEKTLAPPLTGTDAEIACMNCPVLPICYKIGKGEGYTMEDQQPYIKGEKAA